MDDEIKKALLRNLSKEDILELFDLQEEKSMEKIDMSIDPVSDTQKYYLLRKVPGSTKRCSSCGQFVVNDSEHANQLLGGEIN